MDEQTLTEDIQQADQQIRQAKARIRIKLTQAGVCIEAEPTMDMVRGVQAVITWSALALTNEPMITPLVAQMLEFLRRNATLNPQERKLVRSTRLN